MTTLLHRSLSLRFFAFVLLALMAPQLSGCAVSPATGRTFFTGGLSPDQERQMGAQEHEKVLDEFGGLYPDPQLSAYITSIGNLLVSASETPGERFTFTVIDSPIVNAFALPGGYVYITRGLLAIAQNEAEVAGVLAHEIGHVTARHIAERYGQAMLAGILTLGAAIGFGGEVGQATAQTSQLLLSGFSRDQETEADILGVRYLARTGYDPQAMASFLNQMLAYSQLEAARHGRPGEGDQFSLLQTHPRTSERVQVAIQQAGNVQVANPTIGREVYLSRVDGLLYGDGPDQGYVRDRRFYHPDLGFTFEVPAGFSLVNSSDKVSAYGGDDSAIIFTGAREPRFLNPRRYLVEDWGQSLQLADLQELTINGFPAATATTRITANGQQRDLRLLVIKYDSRSLYRFMFVTRPRNTASLNLPFRETTYSFRTMSGPEVNALRPQYLDIYTVRQGDTPWSIAQTMPADPLRFETFLVLNGLNQNSVLQPGQRVKIVVE